MNWLRNCRPITLYSAVLLAFVLSRLFFYLVTTAGEYRLYKSYGDDARQSSLEQLYLNRDIEYPHLGVAFGAAVGFVADHLPDFLKQTVRLRPNKHESPYIDESPEQHDTDDQYEATLGLVLFLVDAWCLWLVFAIVRRMNPDEPPILRAGRLFLYVLFTGTCGLIIFDRQDLVVAWLALLAMWCLASGRARIGYAVLALGAAYKLIPVLLLPVWVIAAATVKCGPRPSFARWVRVIAVEAAIAGVILSAWPILTYACGGGERGFLFLTWHLKRGLQLEAPAAFPVLLADRSVEFGASYGSFNLRGEQPDRVAKVMGLLMPLTALFGMGLAARGFWRLLKPSPPTSGSPSPLRGGGWGEGFPAMMPHVVASTLLIWVAFIAFNKVGSPQYMLWVAPLVPLLPLRSRAERGWALLLLLCMFDTMLIYPCRYNLDLVGPKLYETPLETWRGPSSFGIFLLGIKSITLVACSLWLAVLVWRHRFLSVKPIP